MNRTIEEMKAELVEGGYDIRILSDEANNPPKWYEIKVYASDGWELERETRFKVDDAPIDKTFIDSAIQKAYARLQEQQELEALRAENKELRAFVSNSYFNMNKNYHDYYYMISSNAKTLKSKYNITRDEIKDDS